MASCALRWPELTRTVRFTQSFFASPVSSRPEVRVVWSVGTTALPAASPAYAQSASSARMVASRSFNSESMRARPIRASIRS